MFIIELCGLRSYV